MVLGIYFEIVLCWKHDYYCLQVTSSCIRKNCHLRCQPLLKQLAVLLMCLKGVLTVHMKKIFGKIKIRYLQMSKSVI